VANSQLEESKTNRSSRSNASGSKQLLKSERFDHGKDELTGRVIGGAPSWISFEGPLMLPQRAAAKTLGLHEKSLIRLLKALQIH
jgi:hypothetical protein